MQASHAASIGQVHQAEKDGKKLAVKKNNAIRVPIATGDIELYKEDFLTAKRASRLREVFEVATHIQNDKNLRPLIEQNDVEDDQIVLIPKIGRHELTLGDANDLEDKFENLKITSCECNLILLEIFHKQLQRSFSFNTFSLKLNLINL